MYNRLVKTTVELTIKENDETTAEAGKLSRARILDEALKGSSNANETARSLQQPHHARHKECKEVDESMIDASQSF